MVWFPKLSKTLIQFASGSASLFIGVGIGVCFVCWRLIETQKKLLKMSTTNGGKRHPEQLGCQDEPLKLSEFRCPIPDDTASFLHSALGRSLFESFQHALTRPVFKTHFRVQYLPDEDGLDEGLSREELDERFESRIKSAASKLEIDLTKVWGPLLEGRKLPNPLVTRHPILPDVLVVSSVPSVENEDEDRPERVVIVDRLCGEAVLKGADIFAKGIFVCSANLYGGDRVSIWCDLGDFRTTDSAPSKKKKEKNTEIDKIEDKEKRDELRKTKKVSTKAACDSGAVMRGSSLQNYKGRRIKLGYGVSVMSRNEILNASGGMAVHVTSRVVPDAPPLNGLLSRRLYAQQLPSSLCAHVLAPRPGERVLDMCAAPGGKTTHLASLMMNQGELFALDHSGKKVLALRELFQSLGFTNVKAYHIDAARAVLPKHNPNIHPNAPLPNKEPTSEIIPDQSTKKDKGDTKRVSRQQRKERVAAARAKGRGLPSPSTKKNPNLRNDPNKFLGFEAESFDAILLDPPCSALGLRPRLRVDAKLSDLEEFVTAQRRILWAAVMLLKPGGRLVFSTCTVNPRENEGQVRFALHQYPCLKLVSASGQNDELRIGDIGLLDDSDGIYGPIGGLNEGERRLVQRFHSNSSQGRGDSVGFFVAKFTKTKSVRPLL